MAGNKGEKTRMVVFAKKKSKVMNFSSDKQLNSYLNSQLPNAKYELRKLQHKGLLNIQGLTENLDQLNLDWEDIQEDQRESDFNILDEAQNIFQGAKMPKRRTNAANRKELATNWAKVRPLIPSILTREKISDCSCTPRKPKSIMVVFLTKIEIQSYTYCECECRSVNLLSSGYFPSKPLRASIVFDLSVFKLLHMQLLYGIGRVYAWARGLRSYLQEDTALQIPSLYHHISNPKPYI